MSTIKLSDQRRIKIILLWITVLVQGSIALYLPSFPAIARTLFISPVNVEQTITVFIIGLGISPMLYGPLTDRYGRKPILLFSLSIASIGYIINLFADTISIFIIARIIQGFGCGGILIGGRSIVRDVFSGRELASASSYLSMGFAIGFGVTPAFGGYIATHLGWKENFIFLLISTLTMFIIVLYFLPETLANKDTSSSLKEFLSNTLKEYGLIMKNLRFIQFLVGGLFAYGVVMAYNVMTPFLIQDLLGVSTIHYGYLALLMGISYYLSAFYNKNLVLKLGVRPIFILGCGLIILSGLTMLILVSFWKTNLFYIILPMMVAIFGQALIFSNTISCALSQFSAKAGGKVSAVFSSLQMLLASCLSTVMAILPHNTAISIAIIIVALGLGCILLLFNSHQD